MLIVSTMYNDINNSIRTDSDKKFTLKELFRIGFAVYTKVDESEVKTLLVRHVSGDFESGI